MGIAVLRRGGNMLIEYALGRLQNSISRFVVPSAALSDIQALKVQIELRRRALKDIEIIHARLRLSKGPIVKTVQRRTAGSRLSRPYFRKGPRNRLVVRPV
jgi:hypothetical protein